MPRVSGARSSVPVSPAGCGRLGRSAIFSQSRVYEVRKRCQQKALSSVADWGVLRLSSCITAGPKSVRTGNGRPLPCAAVLQPVPISCHFRGCTVPLQQFVCDSVTLIAVLHFHFPLFSTTLLAVVVVDGLVTT